MAKTTNKTLKVKVNPFADRFISFNFNYKGKMMAIEASDYEVGFKGQVLEINEDMVDSFLNSKFVMADTLVNREKLDKESIGYKVLRASCSSCGGSSTLEVNRWILI